MSVFDQQDYSFMNRALRLIEQTLYSPDPNPRVGCVIVKDGQVVGEGWHIEAGGPHAEIYALQQAGAQARGATAYVTLEPCCHQGKTGPCTNALLEAGIARVVCAMLDPNPKVAGKGLAQLQAAGVKAESGLMEAQAEAMNPGFIKRMRTGLPFVRCKLAMSLDGRTAMSSGESQWITAPTARRDVQKYRARSSAVMTGIGTQIADNPYLNLREAELGEVPTKQPLRIVLDSQLRMSESSRMLEIEGDTLIVTTQRDASAHARLLDAGAKILVAPEEHGSVDLTAMMRTLGQMEINEIFVEAGATLNGALLRARLVDEILIYMAPILMGDSARGLFELPGLGKMSQRKHLDILDMRAIGSDWRIRCRPVYDAPSSKEMN